MNAIGVTDIIVDSLAQAGQDSSEIVMSVKDMLNSSQVLDSVVTEIPTAVQGRGSVEIISSIPTSVLISAIVSLFIFILGVLFNAYIRRKNKRNKLKLYKSVILDLCDRNINEIGDYIKFLENFTNKVSKNDSFNIPLWTSVFVCVKRLNFMPTEIYADTLVRNHMGDYDTNKTQMNNLIYTLEFVEENNEKIKLIYNEYFNENNQIMEDWNTSYLRLNDLLYELYSVDDFNFNEKKYFDFVFDKYILKKKERINGKEIGFKEWNDQFIKPCLKESKEKYEILEKSSKSRSILYLLKDLRFAVIKHNKLNYVYGEVFKDQNDEMIVPLEMIKDSVAYFKKYDLKKCWKIK